MHFDVAHLPPHKFRVTNAHTFHWMVSKTQSGLYIIYKAASETVDLFIDLLSNVCKLFIYRQKKMVASKNIFYMRLCNKQG